MSKKTSNYYGVSHCKAIAGKASGVRWKNEHPWWAKIERRDATRHIRLQKQFATEREAAICVDRWILEYQLDMPLNILKPKEQ